MADRLRTFIAVDVSADPFRDVLTELHDLGRPIRPAVEPLHLTLKFLGDTNAKDVQRIAAILGEVATTCPAFDLDLSGLGAFPRIERPSVIWVGVTPQEPVATLAGMLDSQLEPLGVSRESRPFHPHITLARVKGRPPRELADLLNVYADMEFGSLHIGELVFCQSELSPRGPVYSVLSTAALAPWQSHEEEDRS